MKKAINIWSFPGDMPLAKSMEMAKAAGFDGIEPSLNETGPFSMESTPKEIGEYAKIAKDTGIELTSLASGLGWQYPLTSDSATVRQQAKDCIQKEIAGAALLGVDTILVVPGSVGVDFMPGAPVVAYERAYERAQSGLKELSKIAEDAGIVIGVENVWNKFLLSPLEERDFIDSIGSPYVKAYFDVGNVLLTGYPEHWIHILNDRIKKVHVKDYHRKDGFVPLRKGHVDYVEVMRALHDIGYDDYLIAEVPADHANLAESLKNIAMDMDWIMNCNREGK